MWATVEPCHLLLFSAQKVLSLPFWLKGHHQFHAPLLNGAGALCGVRVVEVRPSLLVLNDLEAEITPRLPF